MGYYNSILQPQVAQMQQTPMIHQPMTSTYAGMGTQMPLQSQMMQSGLKGRPVSSLDEVKAALIDFDGTLFIFPDIANKKIYTKRINMNGLPEMDMYSWTPIPMQNANPDNYISRDEFNSMMAQMKEALAAVRPGTSQASPETPKAASAEPLNLNF